MLPQARINIEEHIDRKVSRFMGPSAPMDIIAHGSKQSADAEYQKTSF